MRRCITSRLMPTSRGGDSLILFQLFELVLVWPLANHFGLQNSVRFGRIGFMHGGAVLQVAKYLNPTENAAKHGVSAVAFPVDRRDSLAELPLLLDGHAQPAAVEPERLEDLVVQVAVRSAGRRPVRRWRRGSSSH